MKDGLFAQNPEYHKGSDVKRYVVTVTGTWNIDVEAYTPEEAEKLASIAIGEERMGIWDMNLEFEAFNEEDE